MAGVPIRATLIGHEGKSEPSLFDGLSAMIVEDLRFDKRVSAMLMSVIINAAVRIGVDPITLLERTSVFATSRTAEWMLALGKQYQATGYSGLMGFTEGVTSEGFTYF